MGRDVRHAALGGEQSEQTRDWEPEPRMQRLSGVNAWIDCNSGMPHGLRLAGIGVGRYSRLAVRSWIYSSR